VPVVSWAAAGAARAYEDLANQIEEVVESDCKDGNAFAIIIEGDSMETKFYAGDRVVFAPNYEPRNGDAVVARLNDGRVYFKYYHRTGHEGTRIKLVSENPNYGPLEFDRAEFVFIYPAWEIKRKLRR
jgi:SOS-response transcriptional repressor LexA